MALNARTKKKSSDYILFNILYEDGSQTSNRKIPITELTGTNEEQAAKAFIEAQDRKIAESAGVLRGAVKTVSRAEK